MTSLSPAKQALLAQRLQRRTAATTVTPRPPGTTPPLSRAQERLWFLEQYRPGTTAYTIPFVVRLGGDLDEDAFRQAVAEVTRRHESLRMRLVTSEDGLPQVVVDDQPSTEFLLVTAGSEEEARQLVSAQLARTFDLTAGGLLRVLLIRLAPGDHVLLMSAHHAITDGWSGEILLRELIQLHAAFREGRESPLRPLPVQYGDHAIWQREREGTPAYQRDLRYWSERLKGVPPLELPADFPRPPEQTTAGRGHGLHLDAGITAGIAELSASHGATPYMALLAALQVLLGRWSGQRDFAVGSPVSGRGLPELDGMAGMFVNTLAMRADLDGDPTFTEFLIQVRDDCLDAYSHQETPFDQLVNELKVERDVSRSAVFQVMFALQNYVAQGAESLGLDVSPFGMDIEVSRFDLALYLWEAEGELDGTFIYNPDLFLPESVARLADSLRTLLQSIVANPHRRLSELDWVPREETAHVLTLGESSAPRPLPAELLHDLVDSARPDAPAVVFDADTVSYADLERRANRLAHRLRELGVHPGDRVAVALEQSAELAVALLGVLKSGAAYVPLDPEQPAERLAYMVADAGVRIAVGSLPVDVTQIPPDAPDCPDTPVDSGVTADDLAYVIYTSGTTGRPKGVAVRHREVLVYLAGVRERFAVEPGGVYALPQSLAFDFGVTVFYLSLMTGGCLHLIPSRTAAPDLLAYFRRARPDYLKITPSHLAALLAEADPAELLPARLLILGGEASTVGWASELAEHCTVINHYGPTEATVGVTTFAVPRGQSGQATLPIGRPLPGARVYVLDERMRPVPAGVPGEIYLGGDRLAVGYLGRPGLTAEKFLPDPYGRPGARVYRTGDLGRWLPDGALQFLGRRDLQVKVRGYRVELGEVETVLAEHPAVALTVVELRGQRLVAYLVGEEEAGADLRAWLKERLPDYMVPVRYVWLDRLPLKSHGKVDRAALPDPGDTREGEFTPPATPVEETVAEIWAAVLGLDRVGALDDFFDLGGHSLLAMQVVARLRKAGHTVTLMELFKYPTVRELARLIDSGGDSSGGLLHRLTPARATTATLVCAPYGGGSAVIYKPLADAMPEDWALYSIGVPGHELGEQPRPLLEVAEECATEIIATVQGPLVLYGHCGVGTTLCAEIARRLEAKGREIEAIYLGGVFPFARPRGAFARVGEWLEDLGGDQARVNGLVAAGLDVSEFEQEELELIVGNRRRGTREAERYFAKLFEEGAEQLRAPVIAVAGERDPIMEYYQERYREWHCLSPVAGCVVLDEAAHYFLKYRAEELAAIVTTVHPAIAADDTATIERQTGQETWWLQGLSRRAGGAAGAVPEVGPPPSMRRFLMLAAGQLVSMTGSALTEFAIPIWIYLTTGSLANFALFSVLGLVPGLLVAPLAGAVVDRFNRRKVLAISDAAAGSTQLILGLLVWTDNLQIWQIYPLLVVLSMSLTFQRVAYTSAIPQLVPKRFLGHANGVVGMATGVSQLVVPLAAAGLLSVIGLGGILVIDVVSYTVAITVVLVIKFPRTMPHQRRESVLTEMVQGFRYTWGHLGIRRMLLFFAVVNLFMSPLFLLVSPLVLSFAELSDVGRVTFFGGLGVFLSGLTMTLWGGPRRLRLRGQLLATLSLALFALVVGARENLAVIAVGVFGMFASLTLLNGIYATIIQVKVPQRFHGRVFALNQLVAFSTLPIGFGLVAPYGTAFFEPLLAEGGALADTVGALIGTGEGRGIAFMYLLFGLVMAVSVLVATRLRGLWQFDHTVPDATPDDVLGYQLLQSRTTEGKS
ncbi:non-ribosomal peptide synthetase/MFS transporter [Acrocarpospora catenulata]|uniref:non-ribosomal peptide synthetase/MFS transporter n=1 Tax=Acrocarpospora catenulata TaxID=2836182 RepID=UPI0027E1CB92|nr:non-ribosomal peptide synthetase [Acrocarpospora catenulata]